MKEELDFVDQWIHFRNVLVADIYKVFHHPSVLLYQEAEGFHCCFTVQEVVDEDCSCPHLLFVFGFFENEVDGF